MVGFVGTAVLAQTPTSAPTSPSTTPAPSTNAVGQQAGSGAAPTIVLDAFDSVSQWRAIPAEGVEISLHSDSNGVHGKSMRIDFDFHGHGGYGVVHRDLGMIVPANYEFSFSIRGDAPTNTLEFKLLGDSTGENVWWSNTPNFVFPKDWQTITRKKRQISFAWGPTTDQTLHRFAAIEIAIAAGSGGKGSVWIDDLAITPLDADTRYNLTPRVTASSQQLGYEASRLLDSTSSTVWRSAAVARGPSGAAPPPATVDIDFLKRRELGALVVEWDAEHRARNYDVMGSMDGQTWRTLYRVNRLSTPPMARDRLVVGARDYIYLPETDVRYLRLALSNPEDRSGYAIRRVVVKPLEWAPTENDFFLAIAADAPRGNYPRPFTKEQSYWTVVGQDRDTEEGLINEEGMIEVGRGQFSIEPFLYVDGKLVTWNDAKTSVTADPEALPLPQVSWTAGDLTLAIRTFAAGSPDSSVLYTRYVLTNNSKKFKKPILYVAIRPLQVNPPWQFLNLPGGVARIDSISLKGSSAVINGTKYVRSLASPSGFGAVTFDEGNIVDWLRAGQLPTRNFVVDPAGHSSAAFAYQLELAPRSTSSPIDIAVPLHGGDLTVSQLTAARPSGAPKPLSIMPGMGETNISYLYDDVRSQWRSKLARTSITLPASASRYTETMRANLAYILINRDGPAIQPGSRSYSRSWIRDGALTSTALLRLGHAQEVKDFIDWYAPYIYDNGKVPCCVDDHGATPVPENDSNGEFIYLVAEYYRHTGDKAELEKMWPYVAKATAYMDSLRHERMTEQYTIGANKAFYGLLPQSISHEGYSAKPMHSYWDDFFALRGFKDATFIATELGKAEAPKFAAMRNGFRSNLFESIRQVVIARHIDFIPGSVELADFDATSTTIAGEPGGEAGRLPGPLLLRTFDKYFQDARLRASGVKNWDGYTPYELRTVGTHIQLGQRQRAHELLDFFFQGQRPVAWHQWAEVVYRDPKKPAFIGDMPHTWVGSDYIRSFLDMFAFERESDSSLVITAGTKDEWLQQDPGVRVTNLSTSYGPLNYDARAIGRVVTINIKALTKTPKGGVVVYSPLEQPILSASINGVPAAVKGSEIRVDKLPATVTVRYAK